MDKDGDLMGRERYRRGERRRDWGGVKGKEIERDGGRDTGEGKRGGRHRWRERDGERREKRETYR